MLIPFERKMQIVRSVATRYGVSVDAMLKGRSRTEAVLNARGHAMALMIAFNPGEKYTTIGRFFRMDHSTVIYTLARYFGVPRMRGDNRSYAKVARDGVEARRQDLIDEVQAIFTIATMAKAEAFRQLEAA